MLIFLMVKTSILSHMGGFPSGQRGQTVNLLAMPSKVRILLRPLGVRIRKIRMFRNITQKELGRRLGYGENSADVRIAQYESGQRTPKQETLIRIAEILEVDVRNFLSPGIATMDELMETLFWMDEENRGLFHLFLLKDSERETVGITMRDKKTMSYLQEWMGKKQKLGDGRITEEEYLEWKLHWPEDKRKTEYKTV